MFIPVATPPPPSAQAKELGEQIALFIMEYRKDNPDLSSMELQQAFMLARQRTNKELGGGPNMKPFIALMLGLAMMGVLGVVILFISGKSSGGGSTPSQPTVLMIAVAVVTVLVVAILAIAIKSKQL